MIIVIKRVKIACIAIVVMSCFSSLAQSVASTDQLLKNARDSIAINPSYTISIINEILQVDLNNDNSVASIVDKSEYYNAIREWDSAIFYANKALPIIEKPKRLANTYRILGHSTRKKGYKIQEAISWYEKGLKVAEKHQLHLIANMIKVDLSKINTGKEDLVKSLRYLSQGIARDRNYNNNFVRGHIGSARSYAQIGNFKSAIRSFEMSLKQIPKGEALSTVTAIYQCLSALYTILGEYDKAKDIYKKGHDLCSTQKMIYHCNGTIFKLKKLNAFKNDFTTVTDSLAYIMKKAKKEYDLGLQKETYQYTLDYYKVIKSRKSFSEYWVQYMQTRNAIDKLTLVKKTRELKVKDQMMRQRRRLEFLGTLSSNQALRLKNQEQLIQAITLQKKLENEQYKNKILVLENKNQKEVVENLKLKESQTKKENELARQKLIKTALIVGASIIIIGVIILLFIYYQKLKAQVTLNKVQEQMNQQEVETLKKDQELRLIKTTIESEEKERERIAQELHDSIGGNLAAIKLQVNHTFLQNENADKLKEQLDDTYELVRNLSHNLMPKRFKNEDFTIFLKDYLHRNTKSAGFKLNFQVFPEIQINTLAENIRMELFKIIQELFINTVKYSKANQLDIQLNLNDNVVKLLFEDDGKGFDVNTINPGIGLMNIKSRLKKLSGNMHIDTRLGRGTIIDIDIPTYHKTIQI
ncbi:tetratricopeptide repeat-containing sensor histidine kinase [Aquimarina algicola]|uniref:histidine kinase n=1 Tax=Aquimarina algicola TaxID=2589995 RepID=A0A504JK18_9FLAO|nr:histidine kinase [Aquimarina algicola]TPN86880.1 hypothetical protein FHK87_04560 [Aquimarina algicola]